ncbi:MAG: Gfo/Idh/MocA family oxidoreductase [Planctomycetes bacterium]|nr:Gfo/Idh/MocA family oxidoreductase [Planctomycetota bacterium]
MAKRWTRRAFLRHSALASGAFWLSRGRLSAGAAPSEQLNLAAVGVGGRGEANLSILHREGVRIVALCDVDEDRGGPAFKRYSWAKKYRDFRRMLDEMEKDIDAVVVSTPDHTHAPASVMAMKMGKHCYCEKPLAHCVYEARTMAEVAAKAKVVTQIGTQHHAEPKTHQAVEVVRSGAIGPIRECHVWIGGHRGGGERPKDTPPVPAYLAWDLWIGPRPYRPYHPVYAPYGWRFWWDFGTGETGNNGVHIMDFAVWALRLGPPLTTEAEGPPVSPETSPTWMHVRHTFPARDDMPPVTVDFYHKEDGPPVLREHGIPHKESGVLFMGEKGILFATYGDWKLYPEKTFADFELPAPTIPKSIGHHREWLEACKAGGSVTCPFDYGGALTETVLLGNVAYRTGEKLRWDAKAMKAANCPAADPYIHEPYREGWTL